MFEDSPQIGEEKNVISHAYDIVVKENYKERGYDEIHFWSLNTEGESILIRLKKYPNSCFLEFPTHIDGEKTEWSEDDYRINIIVKWLNRSLKDDAFFKYEYVEKNKIHYYSENKTSMLHLFFKTKKQMYHLQNFIKTSYEIKGIGTPKFKIYDTGVTPIRKLHTEKDFKFCQWIDIKCREIPFENEERISIKGGDFLEEKSANKEYYGDLESILMVPDHIAATLESKPRILAFDIETYSNNHRSMPKKFNPKHVAYSISCTYEKIGFPNSRKRYLIVYGDCDDIPICDKIYRVNTELDLINTYTDIINLLDPDIITGYNIFGYDNPYLNTRLLFLFHTEWKQCGRLMNEPPKMFEDTWKSNAYGTQDINILMMDGRISIDMMVIVRRDYGNVLQNCKLNTVCKHFLKKEKHDVSAIEMFKIYEQFSTAKKNFNRTEKEINLFKSLFEKEENEKDITYLKNSSDTNISQWIKEFLKINEEIADLKKRLENKKIKDERKIKLESKLDKLVENFTDLNEEINKYADIYDEVIYPKLVEELNLSKTEMSRVMAYCIQDSDLVIDLFKKLNVWISLIKFSGVVGITITDLFTRGQQVRCYSQLYDESNKLGFILDKRYSDKYHFKGAYVGDPIPGFYRRIITLDFNSLYPSIIIAYNICYSTLIKKEEWNIIPEAWCHIIKFSQEEPLIPDTSDFVKEDSYEEEDKKKKEEKFITKHYEFRFVKKEIREGILPRLLKHLLAERKRIKKEVKVLEKTLGIFKKEFEVINKDNFNTYVKKEDENFKEWNDLISNSSDYDNFCKNYELYVKEINLNLTVKDKEQLATKVSANSMYGFLGAQNLGIMPLIEAAMCVTALGRQLIYKVNDYVIEKYNAKIVYGDTDSSMIDLNIEKNEDCHRIAHQLEDEINGVEEKKIKDENGNEIIIPAKAGIFLPPLRMEFEKAADSLFICPKKYAMALIGEDGEYMKDAYGDRKLLLKGLLLARRDNHPYVREIYRQILMNILFQVDIDTSFKYLIDKLTDLLRGNVPVEKLSINRGIGSNYKSDSFFIKIFASELARMGNPMQPGDRVDYVVVKTAEENEKVYTTRTVKYKEILVGYKMRLIEMWETSQDEAKKKDEDKVKGEEAKYIYQAEDIDFRWYISHTLINPIDQLFGVGYNTTLSKYGDEIYYKPQYSKCKETSIVNPVKMINSLIDDYWKFYLNNDSTYTDNEKLKYIAGEIEDLPNWFINQRKIIDLRPVPEKKINKPLKILEDENDEEVIKIRKKIKTIEEVEENELELEGLKKIKKIGTTKLKKSRFVF